MAPENVKNRRPNNGKEENRKAPSTTRAKSPQPSTQTSSSQGKKRKPNAKDRPKRPSSNFREVKFVKVVYEPPCAICGQPIKDSLSAVGMADSGSAVHFDCMIKRLTEREELKEGEQVIYIGGGCFAVAIVSEKKRESRRFTIIKKIDHEQAIKEAVEKWREQLAIAPSFIVVVEKTTVQLKEEADLAEKEANLAQKLEGI